MKTIIIILAFLILLWYLNKKSSNNHFSKSNIDLESDLKLCLKILYNFDFPNNYIDKFDEAYDYFTLNPKEYNGTSIINDRFTIKGLEIQSVVHDYDWIFAKSLKDLHMSNVRYANALRKFNTNWISTWCFLFVGLSIVSIFKSLKYLKL
jgi:hypothetical protein